MSIISKETFDKFTKEEKREIRKQYKLLKKYIDVASKTSISEWYDGKFKGLEELFGKETLQSEPKIKVWSDVLYQTNINSFEIVHPDCDDKLTKKLEATYKIKWLIELGYGGMITEKEWKDASREKFAVIYFTTQLEMATSYTRRHFIAFHTIEQRERFLSYPENVELIKQYYMA